MVPLNQKGLFLETILNLTHKKYNEERLCTVYKIPVQQGWDPKTQRPFFMKHYACDYIGNYRGAYFEFEAKETAQEYFAWKQIRPGQHAKLQQILATQGHSFLIIYFEKTNQFFFVTYQILQNYILNHTQKIPLSWFQKTQTELKINEELKLNYLPLLDK